MQDYFVLRVIRRAVLTGTEEDPIHPTHTCRVKFNCWAVAELQGREGVYVCTVCHMKADHTRETDSNRARPIELYSKLPMDQFKVKPEMFFLTTPSNTVHTVVLRLVTRTDVCSQLLGMPHTVPYVQYEKCEVARQCLPSRPSFTGNIPQGGTF